MCVSPFLPALFVRRCARLRPKDVRLCWPTILFGVACAHPLLTSPQHSPPSQPQRISVVVSPPLLSDHCCCAPLFLCWARWSRRRPVRRIPGSISASHAPRQTHLAATHHTNMAQNKTNRSAHATRTRQHMPTRTPRRTSRRPIAAPQRKAGCAQPQTSGANGGPERETTSDQHTQTSTADKATRG